MANDSVSGFSGEQFHYWAEFQHLVLSIFYTRNYRYHLAKWLARAAVLRAVTSSVSIGSWVIWRQYGIIWGALIATSQVAEAVQRVLPYEKRRVALSKWCISLTRLMVLAQRDWESIYAGRCTETQIADLTHKLRDRIQKAEEKHAPQGLPKNQTLHDQAEAEMAHFFETRYSLQ